jgi:RNA polymerase sigma-70 factor (ECF subfamily)
MARANAGDRESYSRIFELCQKRIYGLAYTLLHHAAEADDCVQETFLIGLEKLSTYRGESSPHAWFAAIALNLCRHRFRDGKRDPAAVPAQKLDSGHRVARPRTRAVVSKLAQKEHGRLIAIALGALTQPQREVFALRYEEELSYEEIGQILGLKTGAARALAHRAKAVLREELGPRVWDSAANDFKE